VQGPLIISGIVAAAMIYVNIYDVFILKFGKAIQGKARQGKTGQWNAVRSVRCKAGHGGTGGTSGQTS
jgi:hypothetical protein